MMLSFRHRPLRRYAVGCGLATALAFGAACAKPALVPGTADPGTADPAAAAAAAAGSAAATPSAINLPLIVRNRSYFDINVYVHRAPNSPGRRVGTISSGSEQTFTVKEADLQAGRQLMLGVRAIAGRSAWVSPSLSVGNNVVARLDVMSDPSGDLGRTLLYLENAR